MEAGTARQRQGLAALTRALNLTSHAASRVAQRIESMQPGPTLAGDRDLEWAFCHARLADGPGTTLDFGADIGLLSLAAAFRGHDVIALDRTDVPHRVRHPRVSVHVADVLERPLAGRQFDQIINCSSVEYVGLAGRYGSFDSPNGDIEAMEIMAGMLASEGRMLLTIPVGRDAVCPPYHRIYGSERLPRLLAPFTVEEEQYWRKDGEQWVETDRATALGTEGSRSFYSLGLFVLGARR